MHQLLTLRSTWLRFHRPSVVSWWRCCGCKRRWCEFPQGQDRVGQGQGESHLPPAGRLVHLGGRGAPVLVPVLQDPAGLGQTLDIDPLEIWRHSVRHRTLRLPFSLKVLAKVKGRRPLTFDVSVPGAVVAHPERRPFLGLGAQGRLQQVVHELVVDFEEGHPQRETAAAPFRRVTGQVWREDAMPCNVPKPLKMETPRTGS